MERSSPSRAEVAALVVILLVAAFFRIHRLDHAPPGLTHDEADHAWDASRVLAGIRPIYFTVGYGREPLYDYATALTMLAVGPIAYASRLTATCFGLLLIPLTWAWARRVFGVEVGLLAAAFLAVGLWPVMVSRQALRSATLPVLLMTAVYCWWCGAGLDGGRVRRRWAVAAGVLLGGTFYTYLAARLTWLVVPALLVYLALRRRDLFARAWRPTLAVLLIAAGVGAPLFGWLLANPGAESRVGDLAGPLDAAAAGDVTPLLRNVGAALAMFTLRGDGLWIYNLPGRPLLEPLQGLLFLGGVAMALAGALRGQPVGALLLAWVAAGMVPNAVTGADGAVTRAVGLMPAAFVLLAWALVALLRRARASFSLPRMAVRRGAPAIAAALVGVTGVATYHDYFALWAAADEVRVAYHHTLVETVRYLDASGDATPVMWSSITPEAPHDPAVVRMTLRRDDLALRWFDARRALLFPDEARVRAVLPEVAALDAALWRYFTGAGRVERLEMRADDFNRVVDIYAWEPRAALEATLPGLRTDASPVADADAPLELPALARVG